MVAVVRTARSLARLKESLLLLDLALAPAAHCQLLVRAGLTEEGASESSARVRTWEGGGHIDCE
jgi:hypothetical protein